jgi:acyl transferase domain-containing protein
VSRIITVLTCLEKAGDTIEARAIANVFAPIGEPLLIGSIKTNVGHTEASSGLASIIKTALAIERGVIPPSINFEKPNPKIDLDGWNLRLVRELQSWPEATTRRASINNFGYGGANAHIIMEGSASWVPSRAAQNGYSNGHSNGHSDGHSNGHSERNPDIAKTNSKVLMLSAKDEQACQKMVTNLSYFLEGHRSTPPEEEEFLESLAYTLGQRRTRFPWTTAYPISVTEGFDSVIKSLRSPKFKPSRSSRKPRIGMVFTGQGAQWHAMGRELVDFYPIYKASLEEGERYLKEFGAEWSLMQELSRDAASTRINEVILSTPICVALQISLVRLLRAWGVVPVAVTSHSSGEIAAAYAVGALSYREAMAFSYYRAILAADEGLRLPVRGGMIAVGEFSLCYNLRYIYENFEVEHC